MSNTLSMFLDTIFPHTLRYFEACFQDSPDCRSPAPTITLSCRLNRVSALIKAHSIVIKLLMISYAGQLL